MQNLLDGGYGFLAGNYTLFDRDFHILTTRLDALLMVLKSCKGESCRKPWNTLHPDRNVVSLREALDVKYDAFYQRQPKVGFSSCVMGHIVEEEGPQDVNAWREDAWTMKGIGEGQQVLGG